jgi:hypothetical protein
MRGDVTESQSDNTAFGDREVVPLREISLRETVVHEGHNLSPALPSEGEGALRRFAKRTLKI